jgi:cytochrome P450
MDELMAHVAHEQQRDFSGCQETPAPKVRVYPTLWTKQSHV